MNKIKIIMIVLFILFIIIMCLLSINIENKLNDELCNLREHDKSTDYKFYNGNYYVECDNIYRYEKICSHNTIDYDKWDNPIKKFECFLYKIN